jgi:hypothetical protein
MKPIKPLICFAVFPLVVVWIFSGSFVLGLVAAVGVHLLLLAFVVVVARLKEP